MAAMSRRTQPVCFIWIELLVTIACGPDAWKTRNPVKRHEINSE
jgi:hypothetical protein